MKGCHVGWDGNLQGLGDGQGGSLLCQYAPSNMEVGDSDLTFSGSWGGGFVMVVVGAQQCLLGGGWAIDMGE